MPDQLPDANSAKLEHQRLLSLINSMADGVVAIDENNRVVLYNAATLNILDLNTAIENQPLDTILQLFTKDGQPIDIIKLVNGTKIAASHSDFLTHYTDGSTANLYLNIAPVHLGYGEQGERGFVLVLRDITREKSVEEERDEFISVVSHELRTPIAIAEGNISNAQFITDRSGNITEAKHALKAAHEQVMFLSDMINDLATLSRAERGHLSVESAPINIHSLLSELHGNYLPEARAKGLELTVEISPELELLKSSHLYVQEILQNFITNALKYTQKGTITITAVPKNGGVEFGVEDTGIGISKPDQEKIFNKFFRSEDYRTKETKGTGLGLYITQKLASLLHAEISVESELNKGSAFRIFIPDIDQPA